MVTLPVALRYAKTSTFATSHGPMYEVKLAALLFLRCKNSGRDFQIASNVDGAGSLDDILVKYRPSTDPNEWHTYFLQLKHKQSAMVRVSSLSGGGGNFSLKKYLKSYIEIKDMMTKTGEKPAMFDGSFENCTFVLYTNAHADDVLSARTADVLLTQVEDMLKTDSGNGMVIKFSPESDSIIYSSFHEMEETFLEARGFLDRLKLFTGQATEPQLDGLIKRELMVRFKGCLCVDVLYRYYEELFKEWCNNSDVILDQKCDFPERAFVETISVKQQESFHLNVNFDDDFWKTYSFDLTEDVSLLQIDTCGLLVTCAKVLQYLRRTDTPFFFFGIDSLLCEQNVVIPVWSCGSTDLLVIASNRCDQTQVRDLFESISNVFESNPNKKVVLLSRRCSGSSDELLLQTLLGKNFRSKKNSFRFSHLDDESKDRILDRDLLFQGHSIALRCLFEKVFDLTETVCNAQLVETLLSNKMLTIGPKLDDVINFFIPRTLNWCNVVKKEILKAEELSDVFAVSGIAIRELQDLAPSGNRVVRSSDPHCADSRFVILDSINTEADFSLLCDKTRYGDVHWLHHDRDGHLRWRRSHGNIDLISQCLDENLSTTFHPDTVLDVSHRVVLVVAEPGMGKTTLVSYLSRETKRLYPHLWVVKVNLKDHTRLLEEQSDVVQFLASAVGIDDKSALEQSFFRFSLEHEGNAVVLLDGFDEISPSYAEQGCTLLDNLLKTRVKSVWVTSRQSMNNVLERNLSCLAFDMEKFTENDQKTFFKKSWANVATPMTNDELDSFLTELLQLLSRSLNDKEKNFTGIPLQTMMLAEVFEEYIKDPETNPLPERLNLLHLFETVIEKKFNVYVKKKSIAIDKNSAYETSELLKRLVKNHMNAALVLLVSEKEIQNLHSKEKIIKKTAKFLENIISSHDKTGIVDTVVSGKPHFIHRTFAEFFAAKWFSKYYNKNVKFLQKHLFSVHFKVIRDIFDRLLARDSELHSAILNNDVVRVDALLQSTEGCEVNAKDAGGRSALHLASSLGFLPKKIGDNDRFIGPRPRHMTELLIDHGASVNTQDSALNWTPLQYALATNTSDAVEVLLQNKADTNNLSLEHFNNRDQQVWGSIIENGFVNFMSLLLDNGLPVNCTFDDKHQLLHKAVIHGREKLVRLLISRGSVVKSFGFWVELLILASGYGHSHVVRILVDRLGDDKDAVVRYVNATDVKGRSGLSEASRFGHAEVVRYLASQGGDIWARDGRGESPLHRSAGQGNLSVVEALLASCSRVANYIDERDEHGWTSIHRAAEDKHTAVLTALIEQGGDIWARDEEGRTPLHIASERGHLEVAQVLVRSLGGDREAIVRYISNQDEEGRTPKEWTTDEERFRWSFEDECVAVAKWLDEVLTLNSSRPSVQLEEFSNIF